MKPGPTRAHIAMWAQASLFRRFTDTNVLGTGSVKIWKTRHKMPVDVWIFLQHTVCCFVSVLHRHVRIGQSLAV